jgi:hypothetical protein
MDVKKVEEKYLKLEPAIDELSEQLVNIGTDYCNRSSYTESISDKEMSGVDPLDS